MAKKYLKIKVHPKARQQGIEELRPGEYKVQVKSAPSRGEANQEVMEIIASFFGLPLSRVRIVRGEKSRHKLLVLEADD